MNLLRGFLSFWYDFLVGDSITLAIGGVLIVLLGFGLAQAGAGPEAQILLPIAAIATIAASLPELRHP